MYLKCISNGNIKKCALKYVKYYAKYAKKKLLWVPDIITKRIFMSFRSVYCMGNNVSP